MLRIQKVLIIHFASPFLCSYSVSKRSSDASAGRIVRSLLCQESVTAHNMTGYFRKCGYPLESREESESEEAAGVILCTAAAMVVVSD